MGNPRIVWNGNILDFPEQISRWDPQRIPTKNVNRAISGKVETLVLNKLDQLRISLAPHDTLQFHRDLQAFWSWASEGNSFAFAFDRNDRVDTTVNATLTPNAEIVPNSNLDTWASDTDAGSWAEAPSGSGAINRIEDHAHVYSGPYALAITGWNATNQWITQSAVTLETSTKYRARIRLKNGVAGNRMWIRIRNNTTVNYLQGDTTWSASTGIDNEPTFTPETADYSLHEIEFTTEGSGTSFRIDCTMEGAEYAAAELLYIDGFSIIKKQKVTLTSTHGVLVGKAYRLREATGLDDEIVIVDAVDSSTVIELQDPPKFSFASADILRSVDYHPALHIPRKKQPFRELPTLVYDLDIRAEEFVS